MTEYFRRVIKISARDSPNVKRWLRYKAAGLKPIAEDCQLVPGVLTGPEYDYRRATWDKVRQCVGLDAQFYEGGELLLFPPEWRIRSSTMALIQRCQAAPTEGIGIDPAEGGDLTSMAAVNRYGLKELVSKKTPNTAVIAGETIAFMRKHGMDTKCEKVVFDRGGGGKQHEDTLKAMGYNVRSVGFGESPSLEIKRGLHQIEERKDIMEERYAYVNLRAQMYHELSLCLDPASWVRGFPVVMDHIKEPYSGQFSKATLFEVKPVPGKTDEDFARRRNRLEAIGSSPVTNGFAVPSDGEVYQRLQRQMSIMPKITDEEGRYKLPPKHRRDTRLTGVEDKRQTLTEMLDGESPDELDSTVLALYAMIHKARRPRVGVVR